MSEEFGEQAKSNAEIRKLYLQRIIEIAGHNAKWIKDGLSIKERAERAWQIRHTARIEARSMMSDAAEVEMLRERDLRKYGSPDGPTFEFLVASLSRAGLELEAIYESIINASSRTDAELNRRLGLS